MKIITLLIVIILSIGSYFYIPKKIKTNASFVASEFCGKTIPIFYRQDEPLSGKAVFVCDNKDYTITFIGKEIKQF